MKYMLVQLYIKFPIQWSELQWVVKYIKNILWYSQKCGFTKECTAKNSNNRRQILNISWTTEISNHNVKKGYERKAIYHKQKIKATDTFQAKLSGEIKWNVPGKIISLVREIRECSQRRFWRAYHLAWKNMAHKFIHSVRDHEIWRSMITHASWWST